jgi:hypothetical protein
VTLSAIFFLEVFLTALLAGIGWALGLAIVAKVIK